MKKHCPSLFQITLILALSFLSSLSQAQTIYAIGDSTMADKSLDGGNPERGWVQSLKTYLKSPFEIKNHARNGRSSRSFINERRWNAVREDLKEGDWVLIQFGHNDQKAHDPKRYTNPYSAYRKNIEQFVRETRKAGAQPILVTSIVRRKFNETGTLVDTHGTYPFVMHAVSDAMDVPLIDLQYETERLLESFGPVRSRELFVNYLPGEHPFFIDGNDDNTHLNEYGGDLVARRFLHAAEDAGLNISNAFKQPEMSMEVWGDEIPHSLGKIEAKEIYQGGINEVHIPKLHIFKAKLNQQTPAILILPGGGYGHLSMEKEGYSVARWMNKLGITAFVLEYRHSPYKQPIPLMDAQKAFALIKENAADWNIDPNKVGIMGFSAGGHLASTCLTKWENPVIATNVSLRPDFGILAYPVISMIEDELTHNGSRSNLLGETPSEELKIQYSSELNIPHNPVPVFLFHAADDKVVPIGNSKKYLEATLQAGGEAILCEIPEGGHGFGLRKEQTLIECETFLEKHNILVSDDHSTTSH